MKKALEEAEKVAIAKKELEEKFAVLEKERMNIQAELEKERQAAIDAEELVFKLESKQQELEEENNVSFISAPSTYFHEHFLIRAFKPYSLHHYLDKIIELIKLIVYHAHCPIKLMSRS